MGQITSDECVAAIKEALKMFGEYAYFDKGAGEIMFMQDFTDRFHTMKPQEVGIILIEVRDKLGKRYASKFVQAIVSCSDCMPEEWFSALLNFDPYLTDMY